MDTFKNLDPPYQYIIIAVLIIVGLVALDLILTFLLLPLMQIFNALTDKNKSNLINKDDLLIGVVTEDISATKTGEILIVDKHGSKIYPARLYDTQQSTDIELTQKTSIIVIDFKDNVALVVKNNNYS